MISALIDIGSNTIRLVVYDNDKEIENYADYAGLIADVSDGEISIVGIGKIIKALKMMKERAEKLGSETVYAFATASLRDIKEKDELVSFIKDATGIEIEIITGEAEAYYDYMGLQMVNNVTDGAAFDLGGGSCQIMVFRNNQVDASVSLPLGGLRIHTDYVKGTLPDTDEKIKISDYVRDTVAKFTPFVSCGYDKLYAMGGSVFAIRSIAETYFGSDCRLTEGVLRRICSLSEEELYKVAPKRIKSVVPAAIVMSELLKASGANEVVPTEAGVRDGILFSKVLGNK